MFLLHLVSTSFNFMLQERMKLRHFFRESANIYFCECSHRNDRLSRLMKICDEALCSLGHQFFCLGQKHPEGHRDFFVDRVMFGASK